MKRVKIGRLDDFPEGKIHGVDLDDKQLIVVNLKGSLHVLDGVCTHAYAELRRGFLTGNAVRCPLHLSQFDIETGEALALPAEEPLEKFEVELEGESVYVVMK